MSGPSLSFVGRVFASFLAVLLFVAPSPRLVASEPTPAGAEQKAPAQLFSRIVVLGASVSAGFDSSQPLGGPKAMQYRFANFLEAALSTPHEPIATEASSLLFLNPPETLERKVTAALEARPSIVIGLDALFWFCYGSAKSIDQRRERFEFALKQLERIDAPIILGDIPNASAAVGGIIAKHQMPSAEFIAECNQRLQKWAADRQNVLLFALSDLMSKATANDELTLGRLHWARGQSKTLLRGDLLHPSRHGLAALAIGVLDFARVRIAGLPPQGVPEDVENVYARALTGTPEQPVEAAGR